MTSQDIEDVRSPQAEESHPKGEEAFKDSSDLLDDWQISDKWTPLHAAAERLDISRIRSILSTPPYNINATTLETHETPLHEAITDGNGDRVAIIQLLVSHGADLNPHDCVGNTPLHQAARGGWIDAVRTLIELGAEVNVDNREPEKREHESGCGCGNQHGIASVLFSLTGDNFDSGKFREFSTPLHVAASSGHADVVKLLLDNGAKIDSFDIDDGTPLTCGVLGGDLEVCRILLEWPGGLSSLNIKQKQGHLPIHYASTGNPEILKLLIEKGAEIDVQVDQPDSWAHGRTALAAACDERHNMQNIEQNTRILLEAGADPNRQLGEKRTPFLMALNSGNAKVAKVILDSGLVDLESTTSSADEAPLLVAATRGQAEMCGFLTEKGCHVNMRTSLGDEYTPLHHAAGYGNAETVKVLIAAGADIEARNFDGRRPLHMACFKGRADCVSELLRSGADVEAVDDSGWTPLHFAASYGYIKAVKVLIDMEGSRIMLNSLTSGGQGGGGCTAADLARLSGFEFVVEIVVAAGGVFKKKEDSDNEE